MHYAEIMLTQVAVVQSMLLELDPRFVVCHHYEKMRNATHASSIATFVAPSELVADMFTRALLAVARPSTEKRRDRLKFARAEQIARRLQEKIDSFEGSLCGTWET